jgi:hypothetical protein
MVVFKSDSLGIRVWNLVRVLTSSFIVIYVPLLCAFPIEADGLNVPALRAAEVVCDFMFLISMIVSSRTIVEQKIDGLSILIKDPDEILKYYLKSIIFYIHIVSLGFFPFYLDEALRFAFGQGILSRAVFLMRMLKTLRIVDIHEVLRKNISLKKHVGLLKNVEVFRVLYWLVYVDVYFFLTHPADIVYPTDPHHPQVLGACHGMSLLRNIM